MIKNSGNITSRLIQRSKCIILPHERNLLKIKNSLGIESEYTKILGEAASTFNDFGRYAILQMDKVHSHSEASYKGGRIIGRLTTQTIHTLLYFL